VLLPILLRLRWTAAPPVVNNVARHVVWVDRWRVKNSPMGQRA
jgi:hypothetical protein